MIPQNSSNTPNPPDSGRVELQMSKVYLLSLPAAGKYVLSARHRGYLTRCISKHEIS